MLSIVSRVGPFKGVISQCNLAKGGLFVNILGTNTPYVGVLCAKSRYTTLLTAAELELKNARNNVTDSPRSRVPLPIPENVQVTLGYDTENECQTIHVKGSNAELSRNINPGVLVERNDNKLRFIINHYVLSGTDINTQSRITRAKKLQDTYRTLIGNMLTGATTNHEKVLQMIGVGYRAYVENNVLNVKCGFPQNRLIEIPKDMQITVHKNVFIKVAGPSKADVGQIAANIRNFRKPEPYKGKGIRYVDEVVLLKKRKGAR